MRKALNMLEEKEGWKVEKVEKVKKVENSEVKFN